jgi:excisionase family DNA binding protein
MLQRRKYPISSVEPNRIYNLQEASVLLGVSRETFYKLIRTGIIKGWKVGRTWRITGEDLLKQVSLNCQSEEERNFFSRFLSSKK